MKFENVILLLVIVIMFYFVITNLIEANDYHKEIHVYSDIYK